MTILQVTRRLCDECWVIPEPVKVYITPDKRWRRNHPDQSRVMHREGQRRRRAAEKLAAAGV